MHMNSVRNFDQYSNQSVGFWQLIQRDRNSAIKALAFGKYRYEQHRNSAIEALACGDTTRPELHNRSFGLWRYNATGTHNRSFGFFNTTRPELHNRRLGFWQYNATGTPQWKLWLLANTTRPKFSNRSCGCGLIVLAQADICQL